METFQITNGVPDNGERRLCKLFNATRANDKKKKKQKRTNVKKRSVLRQKFFNFILRVSFS